MSEETKKPVRPRERRTASSEKHVSLERLNSEPPASHYSSIMSAPAEKHFPTLPVVCVALVISVILNFVALAVILAKSETISVLRDQVSSDRRNIEELKEELNSSAKNS
ncbi:hypothetical protein IJG20_03300 [Candidatus Saccharibacteria bacterium]|nr:hypothetical protein [Candidatus Saccharibacteria bacterium]